MKSYYHAHESAYKQIKEKGFVGWGNIETIEELVDETTENYLISSINQWIMTTSEKMALDLGCGTGTTAFLLSKLGFSVLGIDISETAIEMAQDLAKKQNLEIQFEVRDILELEKLNLKFDLIYDSHCLHCIVFEEDRLKVLNGIKTSISDEGYFILDTMVMGNGYKPADGVETLRFDDDFILWHKTKPSTDRGVIELDGQYWCAQRRIYPESKVLEEISLAGFELISKSIDTQSIGEPWMLRLVLAK